jgi:ABC-type Na+ transport system ATPase subunit NatA
MPAIEVTDLFKSYGQVDAVRGISFRVQEGEVFALLGPNGAGKTTTLEILEGHWRRSGGQVSVLGVDPQLGGRALRERIGVVLQSAGIDAELTVHEVLALYGGCYPRPLPVDDVIALVGLEGKRRARVKTLSGGQRRRLDLALALVGDPDLIFLDEPTTGFDPAARRGAWLLIESLRGLGRTIVLTSHYMDEVQHWPANVPRTTIRPRRRRSTNLEPLRGARHHHRQGPDLGRLPLDLRLDLVLSAGPHERRHVLDHAGHSQLRPLGHQPGALSYGRGGLLRSRDHHNARARDHRGQRERHVAGPRRQIAQQHVQLAPLNIGHELPHRLVQQRSAPHDRRPLLGEQANGQ